MSVSYCKTPHLVHSFPSLPHHHVPHVSRSPLPLYNRLAQLHSGNYAVGAYILCLRVILTFFMVFPVL